MKIKNCSDISSADVLLGFGAGYGTYLTTYDLIYSLIAGIVFCFLLSFIKLKRKQSKK